MDKNNSIYILSSLFLILSLQIHQIRWLIARTPSSAINILLDVLFDFNQRWWEIPRKYLNTYKLFLSAEDRCRRTNTAAHIAVWK